VLTACVLAAAATALGGCASYIADSVPATIGGLPEGVPARPATQAEFPAVHDRPPARADAPLSEAERKKLKEDLIATRERAAGQAPKTATAEKTKSTKTAKSAQSTKSANTANSAKKSEPAVTGSTSTAGGAVNP